MKVARRESASQARRGGTLRTVRIKKRDSTGWRSGAEYVDIEIGWFQLDAKPPEEDTHGRDTHGFLGACQVTFLSYAILSNEITHVTLKFLSLELLHVGQFSTLEGYA